MWEIYAWDRAKDEHRKVTDRPNGTSHGTLNPDGTEIWWFDDHDGDEFGVWVREPFQADGSKAEPAVANVTAGYPAGLEIGRDVIAVAASTDDGTTVWLSRNGDAAEVIYQNEHDAGVSAMSKDETIVVIAHSEHGDNRHMALRALTTDGATLADKWDGKGKGLDAISFSPVRGDQRLLVLHERRGREELLVWDVAAGTEQEIVLDLPGEVAAGLVPGRLRAADRPHPPRAQHRAPLRPRDRQAVHFGHRARRDRQRGRAPGRHRRVLVVVRREVHGDPRALDRRHRTRPGRAAGRPPGDVAAARGRVRRRRPRAGLEARRRRARSRPSS